MISNVIIKYNIVLELVTEEDAQFIIDLRSGRRSTHISYTEPDVLKQISWIKQYKIREQNNLEYYFIVKDLDGNKWGTTRLYNFSNDNFEVGSWVFLDDSPAGIAIKGDIATREIAFEQLGFNTCKFDVRKENKTVLKYHYGYKPLLVGEDELNFYFELNKQDFYKQRDKLIKILL
jgi:hypothetical protein